MARIARVLVANRGEIALRVTRACHDLGLAAVAVYSEADRDSQHVLAADQAVAIGPSPPSESYLVIDKLVAAAVTTGCEAVHPGYGFLAERPEFAEAVEAAGLTFVGPTPQAIAAMGEKTEARRRMELAGVPVVPGSTESLPTFEAVAAAADEMGYPIMLKAAAGGGGKGMRLVRSAADLATAFEQAASEALKAFGNGSIYVEKLVERPRHVEIQVLADNHGNIVHFGERECSVQRRHQKLIEECPSPAVSPDLRRKMGLAAVKAARSVGYRGAGTVEFLLDDRGAFYFLEMNTRIQVEHPVTEMTYGVDLVAWQIRIADGERLSFDQDDVVPRGHAIECRIVAEDPGREFAPYPGTITHLHVPTGTGVRWDGGVGEGDAVGMYYDALVAKLVVWAENRDAARSRMRRALGELRIGGIKTSQVFHTRAMSDPSFAGGDYDTGFVDRLDHSYLSAGGDDQRLEDVAVAVALTRHRARIPEAGEHMDDQASTWLKAARREALRSR